MTGPGTREDRDKRVRELDRMTKAALIRMYRRGILAPGGGRVAYGGGAHPLESWRKDELVSTIIGIEFPGVTA